MEHHKKWMMMTSDIVAGVVEVVVVGVEINDDATDMTIDDCIVVEIVEYFAVDANAVAAVDGADDGAHDDVEECFLLHVF